MTDSLDIIKCPACGCEMQKVFITDKGINLDVCSKNCGGIFFDCREFQDCTSSVNDVWELKQLIEGKNFMPVDESKTRICPACNTPMIKTKSFGVQIDTCNNCGGIFLDNNEFDRIREQIKAQKKKTEFQENQYKNIDLHEFCKDALDENKKFQIISNVADRLNRSAYMDPRYPLASLFRLFF